MLVWQGHRGKVRVVAFSPDGTRIATTAGHSRFVWLWDPTTGKRVRQFSSDGYIARNAIFFPDGQHIAGVYERGGIRVWKIDSGVEVAELRFNTWGYNPDAVAVSPDGKRLIAARSRGLVEWVDPTLRRENKPDTPDRSYLSDHGYPTRVGFSPLGTHLCVAERRLRLFRPPTVQEHASLVDPIAREPHGASASSFAFTPDESRIVVGFGHRAAVWPLRGAEPLTVGKPVQLRGHEHLVRAVSFLPGGETVMTAALDGTVRIWDSNTGIELRSFDWGIGKVQAVAASPDGTLCAAGGETGRLVVWDVDS